MAKDVEKEKKERVKMLQPVRTKFEKFKEYMVKLLGQSLNYGQFGLKAHNLKEHR